jgi:hypothetical protein
VAATAVRPTLTDFLQVGVRTWTQALTKGGARARPRGRRPLSRRAPDWVLIVDTETSTGVEQALLYGAYRFCAQTPEGHLVCMEEGLIYADDLGERDPAGLAVLRAYVRRRRADVDPVPYDAARDLKLRSRTGFAEQVLWRGAYKARATVVMFNAPFDFSRLAIGAASARGTYAGGFSFQLYTPERFRPRVAIKTLDSKRALKGFTVPHKVDLVDTLDLDPPHIRFPGYLLDLRTLVFALTNKGHSLKSAAEAFNTEHRKTDAPEHGVITAEHIGYCRNDVLVTAELYERVMVEYRAHPIDVHETTIYSPASMAKGYLRQMGVRPALDRQSDFPVDMLGQSAACFYGGRAEVHHRGQTLPVRLVDFTSMYPTVVALCDLWPVLTAERIDIAEGQEETAAVQELLDALTVDRGLEPSLWPQLVGIAQIIPDADVLPVRAAYDIEPGYTIGVNPLTSTEPMWFALFDLAASTLLSGKAPTLLQVRRLKASGMQAALASVALHGDVTIDPQSMDPFREATEQRQRLKATKPAGHSDDCGCSRCQRLNFLKVFANSGSYGIFAQINRRELGQGNTQNVQVHSAPELPWQIRVSAVESPGEYCFPPVACVITAGARFMLALLERLITDTGGTWVFCDTDSMAIVATPTGGLIAAPGGAHRLPDGTAAVKALSHAEVGDIIDRFTTVNPYSPGTVTGDTVLATVANGTGHCLAISAKRYAIYDPDKLVQHCHGMSARDPVQRPAVSGMGSPILKLSEHGLGHLMNPLDPDDTDNRNWIHEMWIYVLAEHLGLPARRPDWLDKAALSRFTVSTPDLWRPFERWNLDRPWVGQIKPYNFLLVAHVARLDQPVDAAARWQLIGPYSQNPADWDTMQWWDRYNPAAEPYTITTTDDTDDDDRVIRVQTYADILARYTRHPEHKFLAPDGRPCTPTTVGQLRRRPVQVQKLRYIGKEADRLDETAVGLIDNLSDVQTEYTPATDTFALALAAVADLGTDDLVARLAAQLRVAEGQRSANLIRRVQRARQAAQATRPREPLLSALESVAVQAALQDLHSRGLATPWDDLPAQARHHDRRAILEYWAARK